MFEESKVIQNFALGETKCRYVICRGLFPYLRELLLTTLKEAPDYFFIFH